ncbi:MAG: hypothetical protein LCH61_17755 [Proteobacteria bacterium]|nr:hypothetical protein [Pseudomonadota bacterium]
MKIIYLSIPFLLILIAGFFRADTRIPEYQVFKDTVRSQKFYDEAPVLTAEESLKAMQIEQGFSVQIVAEEPLINSPVSVIFDKKGRIWVVEMENYMPDTIGTGEDQHAGKVVILSDRNGDGKMDHRQVFLDSLVLPRAICLIEGGMLLAESPKLWYYEIRDDKPVKKTLVDAAYAEGGQITTWRVFDETVRLIRPMLGISPDAWRDAVAVLGERAALITVASILQRSEHSSEATATGQGITVNGSPAIRSAGGYLRALTERARAGAFSLGPVVMALTGQRLKARRAGR